MLLSIGGGGGRRRRSVVTQLVVLVTQLVSLSLVATTTTSTSTDFNVNVNDESQIDSNSTGTSTSTSTITITKRHLRPNLDPKTVIIKPTRQQKVSTTTGTKTSKTSDSTSFSSQSIIVLINTPNSGTNEIYSHLSRSFGCTLRETLVEDVQFAPCTKPKSVSLIKSHNTETTVPMLRRLLRFRKRDGIPKSCLLVSALRDPQTWLQHKFMEYEKRRLCQATDMTGDAAVREFRLWIERDGIFNRYALRSVVPEFLKRYSTSLTEEMGEFRRNGGFSILEPVPVPERVTGRGLPVENTCSLLLLDFDELEKHPDKFGGVLPGGGYEVAERQELCSHDAERYRAIKGYQLTDDEIEKFIGDDSFSPYLEEWFSVFGYLSNSSKELTSRSESHTKKSKPKQSSVPKSTPSSSKKEEKNINAFDAATTTYNKESIIAIVNTPKCGTGGMALHFQGLYECRIRGTDLPTVKHGKCINPTGVDIIKSHCFDDSMKYLRGYLTETTSKGEPKKCLIVTAVRNPETWLPSKFMEDIKRDYCEATDISTEQAVQDFRTWLPKNSRVSRHRAQWNIPHFLKMYNTNLDAQMKIFKQNGGYSLLPPVPVAKVDPATRIENFPIQAHCSLLFLQVEYSDMWPQIFDMVAPGQNYVTPENRDELCPANTERNKAVKKYQLTEREKKKFIGDDEYSPYLEEWFRAYGYI